MKPIIFIVSLSFLLSGCEEEPPVDETSSIVGTWESYSFYSVAIKSDGTICTETHEPNSGIEVTFEEDGTFINGAAQGTWSFNSSNKTITTSIKAGSGISTEIIYLDKKEIPWNSHVTPDPTESPTMFVNWDKSLGSANSCQYYMYNQRRFKKI